MLDLSHLSASSTRKFALHRESRALPIGYIARCRPRLRHRQSLSPEEASDPEPDTEGADAAPADEPTAARRQQ